MKKIKIFLALTSLLNLAGCKCNQNKIGDEKEVIKIGIVLPLTGSAAVWGKNALNGINLAMEEINANLNSKSHELKIVVEDSRSESKNAVSSLEKLITQDNIQIVIGDIASSSFLAMAPIANNNKVVILSPGASNPEISLAGDYVFRNWQSDALEGAIDAAFIFNSLKRNRVAILNVNNAYGSGLANAFKTKFEELGGKIVSQQTFEQESNDMRTQLNKIKQANPEIIFMPGYPNEMATVLKQSKELKTGFRFLSTQAFDDPTIIKIAGNAANGTIFSIPAPPDSNNKVVYNFNKKYQIKYGVEPGVCSNTGYDAINIIVKAINNGVRKGQDFKNNLDSLKDFEGAAGKTTFDENGDVKREFIFLNIVNKQKLPYH
jgi:branched-chain amino acid transport system substrate-binding protein